MSNVTSQLNQQFRARLLVVVYENDVDGTGTPYYLESHEVNEAGSVLEGKPLQEETLAGIVAVFREDNQQQAIITGDMPRHVLHFTPTRTGDYTLAWHRPAGQKLLYWKDGTLKDGALKDGPAMVPPMLFIARSSHLYAFALESNRRPGHKTPVWPAPFMNVNAAGKVCLGSASAKAPKDKTFDNLIAYWEEMWWNSKFTHAQNEVVPGGLVKLWKTQLRLKNRPFPIHRLAVTKLTYQSVINAHKK